MQATDLTFEVIAAAMEVHRALGPGLLESVYRTCLMIEFHERKISFRSEMDVPISYKDKKIDCGARVDFLIENELVLELKSVEQILPVHEAQVLTYLRLLKIELGLLINFKVPILKNGIRRWILTPQ